MRPVPILILTGLAALTATPGLAETFETAAPVREATVYPQGASVTRVIELDLPEGSHEIVVTGLPSAISPDALRIAAEGASVGAVRMQHDRALPDNSDEPAEIAAARGEVERLERALRQRDAGVEAIRAEAETARDMIAVLKDLASSEGAATGDVDGLADRIGARILAARQTAIGAETRAQAAEQGREQDLRLLEQARQRLQALRQQVQPAAALVISVVGQGGPASLRITGHDRQAGWSPVYDLRLDQQAETLMLERGITVSQSTGEDWSDVALTFSTARPSLQSGPSELSPHIIRIVDPDRPVAVPEEMAMSDMARASGALMAEKAMAAPAARLDFMGATAIYRYDSPVDLRDGADALRLSLDQRELPVSALVAEAVPSRDSTAYLVVDSENTLEEVILPGPATLYADGAMVGRASLDLTASGDEIKLGFGPIDGIVLERRIPDRQGGDRGMIRRASERDETVILSAENLSGRDYTLRMIDRVPVSEQDDLTVDWQASVQPSETAPDGKRGVLVWEMPLAAGERQEITLETRLRWPDDMELIE